MIATQERPVTALLHLDFAEHVRAHVLERAQFALEILDHDGGAEMVHADEVAVVRQVVGQAHILVAGLEDALAFSREHVRGIIIALRDHRRVLRD
jgi:hypothetical protein